MSSRGAFIFFISTGAGWECLVKRAVDPGFAHVFFWHIRRRYFYGSIANDPNSAVCGGESLQCKVWREGDGPECPADVASWWQHVRNWRLE